MAARTMGRSIVALIAALACVSLLQFHVRQVVSSSILYDDAHNANVAKNFAMGFGYSTSYHEIVEFNPQASTGPSVLLPAAAFIRVFGNQYWVPTFSVVVCIWTTLLLVLALLRRHLGRFEWCVATALIAFALMVYHVGEFGLLGDVPAALLAVASLLYLSQPRESSNRLAPVLVAGLLLGLAIEAKLIAALVIPSALLYLLLAPDAPGSTSGLGRVTSCVVLLAAAFLPVALWEAWQLAAVGSLHAWIELKQRQYSFFSTWSGLGGLQQTSSLGLLMRDSWIRKGPLLASYFGRVGLILFPAAVIVGTVALSLPPRRDGRQFPRVLGVVLVILGAAVSHLVWWWTLDQDGWYRHLLPGTLYFLVGGAVAVAASFRRSSLVGTLAITLILVSWSPHFHNLKVVFARPLGPEPRLLALVAARDEMVQLQKDPSLVFVGYDWWVPRDLEYLLPKVGNFKDGMRLRAEDVAGKRVVLVRNEFFNWEQAATEQVFQATCDQHVLFRRDPFVISECQSLPAVR
jgi:hypothetical protein